METISCAEPLRGGWGYGDWMDRSWTTWMEAAWIVGSTVEEGRLRVGLGARRPDRSEPRATWGQTGALTPSRHEAIGQAAARRDRG
ncbi:MAG: hypothetical protein KAJ55_09170 [Anaerolineales bacterium]|nr:hypothetical protein [Anaerolineales bacterium]